MAQSTNTSQDLTSPSDELLTDTGRKSFAILRRVIQEHKAREEARIQNFILPPIDERYHNLMRDIEKILTDK